MSRTFRTLTLAIGAALLVAPMLAVAQGGRGFPGAPPRGEGPAAARGVGPGGVTRLLNARRELDLTSRQVAQLDSIERLQHAERKAFQERMRPVRDSLMQRARTGQRTPAFRDSLQAQARARREAAKPQMEQMRKRDSSLNAAAERVLNETQRQKVREMQAERRGFERGFERGMRAGRGQRGGTPQAGRRGGMQGGRGMQGGQFGPQGGVRGPQGPGGTGGRGGMPPRRPPMPEPDDR
jgi:hypothetical protein